jgi:ketosteroid isomerase-like protein
LSGYAFGVDVAEAQTNLKLVAAAIDAYNRRDVEALRGLMTEDVDLRPPVVELTGRAYRGHEGIGEWLGDVQESFATARIELLELRDFGPRVLALTEFQVEGHESRMELGSELGLLCSVVDGRIAAWHGFFSHAAALEAAAGHGAG